LVQPAILILGSFAVVRLFRLRGAAVLSLVYRFTMISVLVSPLVTIAMIQSHVDGWWPTAPGQQTLVQQPGAGATQLVLRQSNLAGAVDEASQDLVFIVPANIASSQTNISPLQRSNDLPIGLGVGINGDTRIPGECL